VDLLSPFGIPSVEPVTLAKRLADLSEHTITIVDNGKPGSRHLLRGVQKGLEAQGITRFVARPKNMASRPHPEFDDVASKAEALVLALGDCGSCTSGSILDCANFERRGVPTVTIVSQLFEVVSGFEAASQGLPDLPIVVVPHPVATRSPEELELVGMSIADQIAKALTA
jgi:hypothetical protein